MSDKLEEILKKHCPSMDTLFLDKKGLEFRQRVFDAMKDYAIEVAIASLEKADKSYKNTAVKSIGTALKYFEEFNHETIYKRDIISFLHALYQFESQGLSMVGIGYRRYDGKEITDLDGAYEGGYFTENKKFNTTKLDVFYL